MGDKQRSLQEMSVALMARKLAELLEGEGSDAAKQAHRPTSHHYQQAQKFIQDWRTSNALPEIVLIQQAMNKGLQFQSPVNFEAMFESVPRMGTKVSTLDEALDNDEGPLVLAMASFLATQDFMKKNYAGDNIRAYRGFQWKADEEVPDWANNPIEYDMTRFEETLQDPDGVDSLLSSLREEGKSVNLKTTPLASYSLNPLLALKFAFEDLESGETGTFVEAAIPKTLVVSVPGCGLGEPALEEVVAFDADIPASVISVTKA